MELFYAAIFIEAIVIKVCDEEVRNQSRYTTIDVDLDGHKDILVIWPGNSDRRSGEVLASTA